MGIGGGPVPPLTPVELRALLAIEVSVEAVVDLGGGRRYVPFTGGTFTGRDGLAGVVAAGGVDWQQARPDGVLAIDAHYALRTHDGDAVEVRSTGLRRASPEVAERLALGDDVPPGLGPEVPMKLVEERAPDGFADIDDVITPDEIAQATEGYRRTAGFALSALRQGRSLLDDPY